MLVWSYAPLSIQNFPPLLNPHALSMLPPPTRILDLFPPPHHHHTYAGFHMRHSPSDMHTRTTHLHHYNHPPHSSLTQHPPPATLKFVWNSQCLVDCPALTSSVFGFEYKRKRVINFRQLYLSTICASIMAVNWWIKKLFSGVAVFTLLVGMVASSVDKGDQTQMLTFEAVSDAVDVLVDNLGWNRDDVTISDIDTDDAKFGQTTIYDFDIQAGDMFLPLRLSEEITGWQYLDELPFEEDDASELNDLLATLDDEYLEDTEDYERDQVSAALLAPFQLAGPVELWIQNAELDLPHNVETGILRKVQIADGAVVTVEGASEVRLEHPLQLPLPLTRKSTKSGSAAHLLALADSLRNASRMAQTPLLSLRIMGPMLHISSAIKDTESTGNNLEVRHIAPGSVELVSHKEDDSLVEASKDIAAISGSESWMWPFPSLDGTDPKLLNLERILMDSLGPNAYKRGFFKILTAKASAATFVQVEFEIEIKLTNDSFHPEFWPEWKTRPTVERMQFEVLAKVEGDRLIPVSINQLESYVNVDSYTWGELTGNISFSKIPQFFLPSSPMTLDPL